MTWKLVKWWLVCLFALLWAIWVGGSNLPAQANPTNQDIDQDIFKIGGDLVIVASQTVHDTLPLGLDRLEHQAE